MRRRRGGRSRIRSRRGGRGRVVRRRGSAGRRRRGPARQRIGYRM